MVASYAFFLRYMYLANVSWCDLHNLIYLNKHWFSIIELLFVVELGQLSGVAAILRYPMPDLDEDQDETSGEA